MTAHAIDRDVAMICPGTSALNDKIAWSERLRRGAILAIRARGSWLLVIVVLTLFAG
jgi:hypothetical protein